ncbi:hypothetical protein KY284_013355 [Solanum tuberosum]|nr:hypothetical protein KY284_013355 [Solanum tuberosum]
MQRIPEEFARRCCKNMLNPVYLEVPSGQVWEVEVQHSEGDGQSSKRKRDEEDVASPSFTRKGQCEDLIGYDLNSIALIFLYSILHYVKIYLLSPLIWQSISSKFARKHFLENNGNLLLRVPGSGSWSVKCTIRLWNSKVTSVWKTFVLDNKLKVGDVCVFEMLRDDKLFIDVIIFRAAGSTPMHNIVGEVPGGSDSKSKVVKADNSVPCTEIKHSAEILGHCPLGRGIKRKRPEVDAEDDAVENSQEDVALPSPTKNTKKSEGSCGMHKQQSKIVYNKNKTVMVKDSTIAYQRAKAFKSKNPFIISFMQPSYVSIPYILKIHSKFARKYFLETDGNLMLCIPGSGSLSVKCTIRTKNAKVYSGWKTFMLENKLKVGDVCVFEVIKGTQLCVDVTIFRAAGSTLMHDIVAEVPGGSDSKRKVINHHMCLWSEARCNWNSSPNNPKFIQIITSSDELCRLSTTEIEYPIDQETESDEEEEDIPVLQANANVIEEEEEDIPVNLQANANVIEEEEEDIPVNLQTNANVIEQEISEGYEEHDQQPNIGTGKTNSLGCRKSLLNATNLMIDRSIILLQAKQSSKKSTEVEVIPNRNSEAAVAIGTTDTDTDVSYEESDDESKNM